MKEPKGTLMIIGGAESKEDETQLIMETESKDFIKFEILKHLLPEHKKHTTMELVTTATSEPEEVADAYRRTFHTLGFENMNIMHIESREQAEDEEIIERINKAHTLMFSGGDQFKLTTILGGTKFIERIADKYCSDKTFTVAGTSAGAHAMAKIMIYEGSTLESILKGDVKTMSGLGLIDSCIMDTHFVKRGRFGRLASAVITNPTCVGIGLGEDTALIVKGTGHMKCIGSGMVTIIDGHDIKYTNINETESGEPLCVENLRVHLLCRGNEFDLFERKFYPGDIMPKETK